MLLVVARIPPGRVCTYGDVAAMAGAPGAARAAGSVLARADRPGLPYHRVIAAGGRLGGYSDLHLKRLLLEGEGVRIVGRRVKDFARLRWGLSPKRKPAR